MSKREVTKVGRAFCQRIARDEGGGEVLEYALVAGLVVAGAILTIRVFGSFVAWGWGQIASRL